MNGCQICGVGPEDDCTADCSSRTGRPITERDRLIQVAVDHMTERGYYSTLPTQEAIDFTRRTAAAHTIDALVRHGAIRLPAGEIPCPGCGYVEAAGHHPDCRVAAALELIDAHRPSAPDSGPCANCGAGTDRWDEDGQERICSDACEQTIREREEMEQPFP